MVSAWVVSFNFGETYFIDFLSDGLGELTMDVYLGRDVSGSFLGSTSWTLEPDEAFDVNALGMGNPPAGSTTFWASIDDFSYTVPEPSTAILLTAASFFALRRRRRAA